MSDLKIQSFVLVANGFNPTMFSTLWFVKNGLITEESIIPERTIINLINSQIETKDFLFIVNANSLSFNFNPDYDCKDLLKKVVSLLPDIEFVASGINFDFFPPMETDKHENVSKDLFFIKGNPLHELFNTEDARFGTYMSKNFEDCRLRLDVKPINFALIGSEEISKSLKIGFNFHLDLGAGKSKEDILPYAQKWDAFKIEAHRIFEIIYSTLK